MQPRRPARARAPRADRPGSQARAPARRKSERRRFARAPPAHDRRGSAAACARTVRVAHVLVGDAAEHVVEQAFAQRALRDAHLLDARARRTAPRGSRGRPGTRARAPRSGPASAISRSCARVDERRAIRRSQALGRDRVARRDRARAGCVADRADRAGAADRVLPALRCGTPPAPARARAARPCARARRRFSVILPSPKNAQAQADAAHVQALQLAAARSLRR